MGTSDSREVRNWYDPRRDRELSDAICNAVAKASGTELTKAEYELFEDVDPAALDELFRASTSGNTTVTFNTANTVVRITPGRTYEIRAASLTSGE